jgi:hypothetical protein
MPHVKGAVENLKWPNQSKPFFFFFFLIDVIHY